MLAFSVLDFAALDFAAHAQAPSVQSDSATEGQTYSTVLASAETASISSTSGFSQQQLRQLMRPRFQFGAQWLGKTDGVELSSYDAKVTVPTYPFFGPPPPMVSAGFEFTNLNSPASLNLPSELYESSIGVSWMRKRNDRWMFRWMLGVASATDGKNISSDSWQFRGGGFALFRPNDRWTWTFGAIALGRNDIPVVPAIGLIYQPNPALRLDLAFPRPRVNVLLTENNLRQQWAYFGAGLDGGTWAYQRSDGIDDQLTYRDWRVVLGWESAPRPAPGMPFAIGRKMGLEIGYAFAREFEFESGAPDQSLGNTFTIQAVVGF